MTSVSTSTLQNPTVRAAIDALQQGNKDAWSALFEPNAQLFDDGSPRDLHRFSKDAIGHERFTSIDQVSADGLRVSGRFHSDQWGDFNTYFQFKLSASGRIARLDIGQA